MMMKRLLLVAIMVLSFHSSFSEEIRYTLHTVDNEEITIVYEVIQDDSEAAIRFKRVIMNLSDRARKVYKDSDKLDIVFFDEVRAFDKVTFTGLEPKPFKTPSSLRYESDRKGYYFLKESPQILFSKVKPQDSSLDVPLYLAYSEKKGKVRLIEGFPDFSIKLRGQNAVAERSERNDVISYDRQADVNDAYAELEALCQAIRQNLKRQKELPFDDILASHIDELGKMQRRRISSKADSLINATLDLIDAKRQELKEIAIENESAAMREIEMKERQAAAELKAEQDAIREAEEQKAKEKEKRNILMIIGGAVLGVLGFGGNQIIQHVRNSRNQKSMMEMQQNLIKQAEGDVKRRVKSYTANTARQSVNKVRTAGRKTVQDQITKAKGSFAPTGKSVKGNGKKNFSI